METKPLDDLLVIAIEREEEARDFYRDLHDRVDDDLAKDTLVFLAREEEKHRDFLVRYRDGTAGPGSLRLTEAIDYRIAEHLEEPDITARMGSKDVYLVAAHRERQSHAFYQRLAESHPEGEVRDILLRMASEELKHKEKVEYLYSNTAFPQTAGG